MARISFGLRRGAQLLARGWPGFVLLGWTAIVLLSLGGIALSWSCLRRRMLGRELLSDGPLVAILARLCAQARVERRVRLSVSTRISSPFSTGLLFPEVCVPSAVVTELTLAQQEALLAHELAHLVRRDPAWFGAAFLIERLFFFQPLNRLARREISELAEVACDDWAVRWTGARLALASCLTEVAGWIVGEPPRTLALPGLAGQSSRLGRRVARLLDDRRSPANEPRAPWWAPLSAVALALTALAVPGVSASQAVLLAADIARGSKPESAPSLASTHSELPIPVDATSDSTQQAGIDDDDANAPLDVLAARETLELELGLLQSEIDELHAELEAHALRERFAGALERIDGRMAALEHQHERVRELLAALAARNTTSSVPAPALDADPTDPSNLQRVSR